MADDDAHETRKLEILKLNEDFIDNQSRKLSNQLPLTETPPPEDNSLIDDIYYTPKIEDDSKRDSETTNHTFVTARSKENDTSDSDKTLTESSQYDLSINSNTTSLPSDCGDCIKFDSRLLDNSNLGNEEQTLSLNEESTIESSFSESELSGNEGELESDLENGDSLYLSSSFLRRERNLNPELPNTVTILETPGGGKVYLVGTAHFSRESQDDVAKTIRETQPDAVMVELCKSRVNILQLDEKTVLEEVQDMNLEKMRLAIKRSGWVHGVMYLLLLNMSAHLTKELGMAPGGEFRSAFTEAKRVPGCMIHLGDRPIQITMQRALSALSLWQKIRLAWYIIAGKGPITKEEVERCKNRDLLEELLAEMTGEFPALSRVFVQERDIYLTHSLQIAMNSVSGPNAKIGSVLPVVVGIVGIGHVPGIVQNWNRISEADIPQLLHIPEATLSGKIIRYSFRASVIGLFVWGCWRILPLRRISNLVVDHMPSLTKS
uniref:TraB domain-containing protein n=1 Tax=Strigamia maritima TaxID=126957 RepID=T1IKH6_STRMM